MAKYGKGFGEVTSEVSPAESWHQHGDAVYLTSAWGSSMAADADNIGCRMNFGTVGKLRYYSARLNLRPN
jgi:hypothetical protein